MNLDTEDVVENARARRKQMLALVNAMFESLYNELDRQTQYLELRSESSHPVIFPRNTGKKKAQWKQEVNRGKRR